jgi:CheY-like chemotaxis protein
MPGRPLVLLVEDDDDLRASFRLALVLAQFDVSEARGGFEALRQLATHRPDVVVLDLMLPGLDGYAVRSEIEAHADLRSIPVVVVTGYPPAAPDLLNSRCVLTKPISPATLIAAVEQCLTDGSTTPPRRAELPNVARR